MITTELVVDDDRTLMVKRVDPTDGPSLARLGREATMLAIARHPGVVELTAGGSDGELRTVFVGARTLADPVPVAVGLEALAAAAGTVADLHGLGIVHGRLDPDHVVLDGSGRAVLCGLAESGLAGDQRSDGTELRPSLDVAALGTLLAAVLAGDHESASRPPRRREPDRAALLRLADRAAAEDPALRPSARAFAATLDGALDATRPRRAGRTTPLVGDAPSPPPTLASAPSPSPAPRPFDATPTRADPAPARPTVAIASRGRVGLPLLGALAAGVVIALGLRSLIIGPSERPTPRSSSSTSPSSAPTADDRSDPADADRASQPGGEVVLGGHRYSLGTPEDQVLVAVWACAGPAAPVLVRPDGAVFRFESLATPDHDVAGVPAGQLPAGTAAHLVRDGDGCFELGGGAGADAVTIAVPSAPTPSTSS